MRGSSRRMNITPATFFSRTILGRSGVALVGRIDVREEQVVLAFDRFLDGALHHEGVKVITDGVVLFVKDDADVDDALAREPGRRRVGVITERPRHLEHPPPDLRTDALVRVVVQDERDRRRRDARTLRDVFDGRSFSGRRPQTLLSSFSNT